MAQGYVKEAPNETWSHWCRLASQVYSPLHFANVQKDQGLILGQVIKKKKKKKKKVLDFALRIKDKVEQSREWSSTLPYISV